MEYYECRNCNTQYETHKEHGKSQNLDQYIKYLGFCNNKCWDKLDQGEKDKELMFAYIYGDTRKKNNFKVNKKIEVQ